MTKVTPFLMYNDQLADAIDLYQSVFPGTQVHETSPGPDGRLQRATFTVGGQRFHAFNGGDHFTFNDGVSLYVDCADQKEVDRYWNAILDAGGQAQQCGWIKDPFGLRWQIIPRRLMELMNDPDPDKAQAVTDAMLQMVKIDLAGLEDAYANA